MRERGMMEPRWCNKAALAVVAITVSACPQNFKAVEAAGEAGQKLSSHVATFDAAGLICLETAALSGALPTTCAVPLRNADRFKNLVAAIVAYSTKLAGLAQAQDIEVTAPLNSALAAASQAKWSGLTEDANSAIASFANAVVGVLSA